MDTWLASTINANDFIKKTILTNKIADVLC